MRSIRIVAVMAAGVCSVTAHSGEEMTPFTEEAVARGFVYKQTDMTSGLPFGHQGYGVGFVDLDEDGDLDIVALGAGLDGQPSSRRVGIFENDGTANFINHTLTSGIGPQIEMVGFSAADYDGDSDLDLYICNLGMPNVLLRNDGDFTFTDVTAAAGVGGGLGDSNAPSWADFNGDGWLDLYVANYNGISGPPGSEFVNNFLYQNNGDGTFSDVSVAQGVNSAGLTFSGNWFDYDRDGDMDLYLSNDRGHLEPPAGVGQPNELYRNDNGQLVDVSEGSGADVGLFSMGVACGDFDGNGYPDVYCTNVHGYPEGFNNLLLNQGDGTFVESHAEAGVGQFVTSWGAMFWDFDNDADQDLYVNNMFELNMMHMNLEQFPCLEVAGELGIQSSAGGAPNGALYASFTLASGDVDEDGDLDLLVGTTSQNVELFINHEGDKRNSVRLDVVGEWPNVHAIGANAELSAGGTDQFREVLAYGNGYLGQNGRTLHFGVGEETIADQVVVQWPGGGINRALTNVPAGQRWKVYPPSRMGDANDDGDVTFADYPVLAEHFGNACEPGCEVMDFDGDFIISVADVDAFLAKYTDPIDDCDRNGVPDLKQILLSGGDANANGVLDQCEGFCAEDLNGSGLVDSVDLNMVLLGFGCTGGSCIGDINGSGATDSIDLNLLLAAFGTSCK